jgi:CMP-N-acetylneuraminic acid synthetase
MMKVAAFLPAKGSSERIPSKNLAILDCKPLFLHTLEKLCKCDFINEVYLDSESDNILNYASFLPYKPLKRDPALATNKTDGHQMFYNEIRQVDADIYIQILGTSPFIKPETIHKGIDILKTNTAFDSVVMVKSEKQYRWERNIPLYDIDNIPNSKDLPDTVTETMGLYSRSTLQHRIYLLYYNAWHTM